MIILETFVLCCYSFSYWDTSAAVYVFNLSQSLEQQHGIIPDRDAEYRLFDRVVNVRESFSVPLGLRGTIIGIKGGCYDFHLWIFVFKM